MPIVPQTLNLDNLRTTSAKSINLYTIRKLIEYSLKDVALKAMFTLTVFEILLFAVRKLLKYFLKKTLVKAMPTITVFEIFLFDGRSVLLPAQRSTGSERVKVFDYFFEFLRERRTCNFNFV